VIGARLGALAEDFERILGRAFVDVGRILYPLPRGRKIALGFGKVLAIPMISLRMISAAMLKSGSAGPLELSFLAIC
jgi:hypothetical protein